MLGQSRFTLGDQRLGFIAQAWHSFHHFHRQVIPAHFVKYHHIERRGSRAFLVKAAHMKTLGVRPPMYDLVDRPLVAMKGEHYRLVAGKQLDKAGFVHPVRVGVGWKKASSGLPRSPPAP